VQEITAEAQIRYGVKGVAAPAERVQGSWHLVSRKLQKSDLLSTKCNALLVCSRPLLDRLAMVMQHERARDLRFRIEGHTDAKGSALANELLSRRRAETVVRYLGSRGVDAARLAAEGKGFRELSDPANPLSEQNRRVSVVVIN
jgi:hypothetical protein